MDIKHQAYLLCTLRVIPLRPKKNTWVLSNQTSPALVDVLCKSQTAGATWTMCLAEYGMSGLGAVTTSSGVPLDDDLLSAASRTGGGLLRAGRNGAALPPRPPSSRRSLPWGCDGMMHSKSCSEDEARGGVYIVDVPGHWSPVPGSLEMQRAARRVYDAPSSLAIPRPINDVFATYPFRRRSRGRLDKPQTCFTAKDRRVLRVAADGSWTANSRLTPPGKRDGVGSEDGVLKRRENEG
ncbi:hypothetical protein CSOJ01_02816 [Colletotrichum sojae]|uniref:Uncharacterized protein n=1 Tax=Colletotrichum sojae TaxID=2175907 RepID=A0A8H6JQ21_9PEZI|nr:hypothetical protein CSOJ01_02816 [Colletotrichum sojae]